MWYISSSAARTWWEYSGWIQYIESAEQKAHGRTVSKGRRNRGTRLETWGNFKGKGKEEIQGASVGFREWGAQKKSVKAREENGSSRTPNGHGKGAKFCHAA